MKAISLWQPWASLIADGRKRIETRHWYTSHRGLIAIHAAKRVESEAAQGFGYEAKSLPRGAVVCVARLEDCIHFGHGTDWNAISDEEKSYGDFSFGRFGWILMDILKLAEPIPTVGRQGLFDWDAFPPEIRNLLEPHRQTRSSRA